MDGECAHSPDDCGVCEYCGEVLGYSRAQQTKGSEAGWEAAPQANIADLPPELAQHFHRIYAKISHVERAGHRFATFYALYHAYMENLSPQPPELLIRLVGLSKKEARKTFTAFAESKTGYRPPDIELKPKHYVVPYFEALGLGGDELAACAAACELLEARCPGILDEHPPQKICAALLFYYFRLLPLPAALATPKGLNEVAFSDIVGLSLGALKSLAKKLARFLPPVVNEEVSA